MKNNLIKIFNYSDLKNNKPYEFKIKNRKLFLIKIDRKLHILSNYCLHKGAPLSKGKINNNIVECPWHGCKWNLITGENNHNYMKIKKYDYQIIKDEVYINDF